MKKYFFGYIALTTALFWETLFGAVIVRRDLLIVTYPFKWLAAQIWQSGLLPLWNSAGGSGMPLLADPVTGAFDPFLPLFMLPLGIYQCGTIYIWLKYLLAGLCMHRYLRVTGASHGAAFLGGAAFMLSGFSIGSWTLLQWVSALMFLPLVMTVPHVRGTPAGRGISAAVILAFSFWSGAIEPTLFMTLFWIAECLAHRHRGRAAEIAIGLLAFVTLSLFQFLPTFEMALLSDRQGGLNVAEALGYSVSPFQMIGLISPITFIPAGGGPSEPGLFPFANPLFFGTYIGVALLPLALLATGARRFFVFGLVGAVLSAGRFLPGLASLLEAHPFLATLRYPVKLLYFVPPSLAILAAKGWSAMPEKSIPRRAYAALGALLLVLGVFTLGTLWPDSSLPTDIASMIWSNHLDELTAAGQHAIIALLVSSLLIIGFDPQKKWIRPLIIAVVILDLFVAARSALFFESSAINDPPKLRQAIPEPWPRVLSVAQRHFLDPKKPATKRAHDIMLPNAGIPYFVRHAHEYGSFRLKSFNSWFKIHVAAPEADIRNLAAAGIGWFVCDETVALGAADYGWKERARDGDLVLLECPLRINELRFYDGPTMPTHAVLRGEGTAVASTFDLNGRTHAGVPTAGWLYRAENYYPGWKAYADGREIPIHEAADFFGQMVYLNHPAEVTFRFEPPLFSIGLFASFCAAVLLAAAITVRRPSSPR